MTKLLSAFGSYNQNVYGGSVIIEGSEPFGHISGAGTKQYSGAQMVSHACLIKHIYIFNKNLI